MKMKMKMKKKANQKKMIKKIESKVYLNGIKNVKKNQKINKKKILKKQKENIITFLKQITVRMPLLKIIKSDKKNQMYLKDWLKQTFCSKEKDKF